MADNSNLSAALGFLEAFLPVALIALYGAVKNREEKERLEKFAAEVKLTLNETDTASEKKFEGKSDGDVLSEFVAGSDSKPGSST
jgi:hypothetical protein